MKNRWLVLIAGVLIQSILGGVYAWSSLTPWFNQYGISKAQSGFIFGVTIAVFTVAMIGAGQLVNKKGPRVTALIGALLYGCGYLLAAYSGGEYLILLLAIGGFAGAGIGFGYVCPLSVGHEMVSAT